MQQSRSAVALDLQVEANSPGYQSSSHSSNYDAGKGRKPLTQRLRTRVLALTQRGTRPLLVLLLLLLLGVVLVGTVMQAAIMAIPAGHGSDQYSVYLDAGSSGTRVRVFRYTPRHPPGYVQLLLPEPSMAVEPGLSAYADEPQRAADSLDPLLEFAYQHVPEPLWRSTPVRLLATAGLRLLTPEQQEAILDRSRIKLANTQFQFAPSYAAVIGGEMEGLYGWAALNYVTGALQEASNHGHHSRKDVLDPSQLFVGLLEMGGASMQLTFLPSAAEAVPEVHGKQLQLPGVPQRLYAHSYLGLGMDSALAEVTERVLAAASPEQRNRPGGRGVDDPCLPLGYVSDDGRHGNASLVGCMEVVARTLPSLNCTGLPLPPRHDWAGGSRGLLDGGAGTAHGESDTGGGDEGEVDADAGSPAGALVAMESDSHTQRSKASDVNPADAAAGAQAAGSTQQGAQAGAGGLAKQARRGRHSGRRCTLLGAHLPQLQGSFVAVENFAWTARALGLPERSTLRQLQESGSRYCARHWSSLHAEFSGHVPDQYLVRYCFGAAYILLLLHDRLGIGLDEQRVSFTNTVPEGISGKPVAISWVLGAAVVDAMHEGGGAGGWPGAQGDGEGGAGKGVRGGSGALVGMGARLRMALLLPLGAVVVLLAVLLVALVRQSAGGGGGPSGTHVVGGRAWWSARVEAALRAVAGGVTAWAKSVSVPPPAALATAAHGAASNGQAEPRWSPSQPSAASVAAALLAHTRRPPSLDVSGELDPGLQPSSSGHSRQASGGGVVSNDGSVLKNPAVLKAHTTAMRRTPSFTSVNVTALLDGMGGASVPHGGVGYPAGDGSITPGRSRIRTE